MPKKTKLEELENELQETVAEKEEEVVTEKKATKKSSEMKISGVAKIEL